MKQKTIYTLLIAAVTLGITSCLKKDRMNIDTEQGPRNVVEFANSGNNASGALSKYPRFNADLGALETGQVVTFPVNISYSGVDVAPQDIVVTLELSQAKLDVYNTQNSSNYVIPDAAVFSFPTTATIPKGQRQTTITVTVTNNSSFDFSKSYGLPISIASTSLGTISGNFGMAVYSFGARNKYDGVYQLRGAAWRNDPASNLQGPVGPKEVSLVTYGATSIQWSGSVPWANGSNSNLPGGYEPIINLDEATNKLSLSSSGNFISADPAYDQHYDPATKTYYIRFTWGAGVGARLHTDTLTFLRTR